MYHLYTDHKGRKVCATVSRMGLLKPWTSLRDKSGTLQRWYQNLKKGCLCWHVCAEWDRLLSAAPAACEGSLTHEFYHCICLMQCWMCFSQVQPCLSIVAVLLSAALGGCTLNVLAQTRQIMFNVLLVLRLDFLRSLIINTENQDRTVVSLRQGRQLDVVSGITCRSEKGRGSPCVCSSSRPTCSPCRPCCRGGRAPRHPPHCAWAHRAQHNLQMPYALCLEALQGSLSCFWIC